jgi:hypothetical protein
MKLREQRRLDSHAGLVPAHNRFRNDSIT